jgi:BirA family biotin operon repressor/biotin-[acetyl-CoA-carboxylase] ligase
MDEAALAARLPVGSLGVRWAFHASVASTQDLARQAAERGAPHGQLVIADWQSAGRGRGGKRWHTPPGKALAFSVVLRPVQGDRQAPLRWNVAPALALCDALQALSLEAQIKWPNDVLLGGRKCAGVLLEVVWHQDRPHYGVLGVGLNVLHGAEPAPGALDFPATCVEEQLGRPPDRLDLLVAVLRSLDAWLAPQDAGNLIAAWEARLAYLGEQVEVNLGGSILSGRLAGLDAGGRLKIVEASGRVQLLDHGEASLRPAQQAGG